MSDLTDCLRLGVVEYEKRWSGDCHSDKGGPVDYEATLKIMVQAADRIEELEKALYWVSENAGFAHRGNIESVAEEALK